MFDSTHVATHNQILVCRFTFIASVLCPSPSIDGPLSSLASSMSTDEGYGSADEPEAVACPVTATAVADIAASGSGDRLLSRQVVSRSELPHVQDASLADMLSQVDSPASHWLKPLLDCSAGHRKANGQQTRKIKMLSLCTGMWSEGMVAQAISQYALSQHAFGMLRSGHSVVVLTHAFQSSSLHIVC